MIGLTGGIATGKSTVAAILRDEYHIPIIDADLLAREVVQPGQRAWRGIVREFGADILMPNQQLDRGKLGAIIFADESRRKILNRITHPEIHRLMFWRALRYLLTGHRYVIFDIPLLYETNSPLLGWLRGVIVVTCCPESKQLERLTARNPEISRQEAVQRIGAQLPLEKKCARARWVIDNSDDSSDKSNLRRQVAALVEELNSSYAHWIPRILLLGTITLCGYLTRRAFLSFT